MSHFLERLTYFSQPRETVAHGHGETNGEDRPGQRRNADSNTHRCQE